MEQRNWTGNIILLFITSLQNVENSIILQFRCNRNGCPILKGKSEKMGHMKIKGTIKTEVACLWMMKVTKQFHNEATKILVSYQLTLLGH